MSGQLLSARKVFAGGTAVIFLLAAVHIAFFVTGSHSGEVQRNYLVYAEAMLAGCAPYTGAGGLSWEYPPLAFIFMLVPALISTDPHIYQATFSLLAAGCAALGLWLTGRTAALLGNDRVRAMELYLLFAVLTGHFLFERFDIFPAVMTLGALCLYLRDRQKPSFALLAVATVTKLYPAVFFLVFLSPLLARRNWRAAAADTAVYAGSGLLLWLPFVLLAPDNCLMFLTYQSGRGIQLESTAAGLILALEMLGLTATWTDSAFGSFNLGGSLPDALNGLLNPLLAVATLAVCLACLRAARIRPAETTRMLPAALTAVLLTFIVLNKVFSAQYLIWLMPLAAVTLSGHRTFPHHLNLARIFAAAAFAATAAFVVIYDGLCLHDLSCVLLLIARNLLLIALLVLLLAELFGRGALGPAPARPAFLSGACLGILLTGTAIRLVLAPLLTYPFDIEHWSVIIQNMESGNGLYGLTGYFYTPVWGYLLGAQALLLNGLTSLDLLGCRFTDLLGIETLNDIYFTATTTTPLFNVAVKAPLMASDLLIGWLVYRMVLAETGDRRRAALGFGLWYLCPVVIYMSAVQAQFDCLSALFALLSTILLRHDRCFLAGALFALAALTKFFPAFLIALFTVYVLKVHEADGTAGRHLAAAVAGAGAITAAVFLPQLLDGTFADTLTFVTDRASATSAWWFRLRTYLCVGVAVIVTAFIARWFARRPAAEAPALLYPATLMTLVASVLIAVGPQYCIVFLPLLSYYVAARDRRYRRCELLIGIFGVGVALGNNSFSLLTSAGEFWGWWSADWIVSAMRMFETPFLDTNLALFTIGACTCVMYLAIILILVYAWAGIAKNPRFSKLRRLALRLREYGIRGLRSPT